MLENRALHCVLGAYVADAAALGFHWLYDQSLIARYGGDHPEFHLPNREEYGDKGYFAHEGKAIGDLSHYGAQLTAMLDSLQSSGDYQEERYIQAYRHWFDFGGMWQGYIDHPTRGTLLNIYQREAQEQPLSGCGADDTQNPALSNLPALIAYCGHQDDISQAVESAVRVTNNNDQAVLYAQAAALMLQSALRGGSPYVCVMAARNAGAFIDAQIDKAESLSEKTSREVAAEVGMACQLEASFVVICHLLLNTQSYEQAIRENILCGGDSCGRAITLGAVLGACYSGTEQTIPAEWITKTQLPPVLFQSLR
ncbi:ADP-ribosylglycohydrolase family protein [Parendozoicomonas haliclonae]|uniref:ADP-ribosylglycohydrolase n=1 Tax=Parendozoicomonas haliclonae TaxID=1960125 RepID=A0A1X7APM3_9GAMM|nr:ADP-ribosylglycohydrolase family protein [Parendozoicomonas haliclonae]SMA50062.1 ADP-ribosylglycohydrolase [Parendozoicomonas haliclonae]